MTARRRSRCGSRRVDTPSPLRLLAEIEDARSHLVDSDDFRTNQIDHFDVLQLLATASVRDLLGSGLRADLHFGRLTLDFGSRRLVARNRFRNTTNSFDGAHVQIGKLPDWRVRGFVARPVLREEDAFDDDRAEDQHFWGGAFESRQLEWANGELYYFGLNDRESSTQRDLHTLGARLTLAPKPGRFDYEAELAGQLGEVGGRDQHAFLGHGEVGYTFAARWTPRLLAQLDWATGTESTLLRF